MATTHTTDTQLHAAIRQALAACGTRTLRDLIRALPSDPSEIRAALADLRQADVIRGTARDGYRLVTDWSGTTTHEVYNRHGRVVTVTVPR